MAKDVHSGKAQEQKERQLQQECDRQLQKELQGLKAVLREREEKGAWCDVSQRARDVYLVDAWLAALLLSLRL